MKSTIFNIPLTSSKLRENMTKQFGVSVNLEKYSREQLEDIRNKLRTKISQHESAAGMNELLTNETYQKDKAMLQLLNTRIKEMLGEDIKKLRDKLAQIDEAKKGVRAPKYVKKAKGSSGAADKDGDGKKDFDDIQVARMTAGGVPKKKAIAKATSDNFKEDTDKETHDYYFGKDKPKSDVGKSKELSKHTATTTGSGTKYTKRDLPGQDTADDADEKARKRKEKKMKESEDKCNHTAKGKKCPVHGLKECGTMEGAMSNLDADRKDRQYQSRQAKTTMKHVQNPTPGEKAAAKDIKPGIAGYKDRVAMLKSAEKDGRLKEYDTMEGKDEGKPGKNFAKIAKKAGQKYGSKAAGERVAGAVRQKLKKAGKLEESQEIFRRHVRIVNESLAYLLAEDEEGKAKAITAAGDMVNDYTSWMQRVGQYQTKSMIELADAIRADFGAAEAEAFKQAVGPALSSTLETLTAQREAISNAVAVLAGEATPMDAMGMEPSMDTGMEPGMDATQPDMMNEPPSDEFGAADAAAGGPEAAGREMRENKFQRKLAESHSIMAKLAR